MAHGDCRMYEAKFPEVDDVVMVQVKSIAEMGAYVSLLEYNNIEGMILLSELSRRRIRSITKLIKACGQPLLNSSPLPLRATAAVSCLRCCKAMLASTRLTMAVALLCLSKRRPAFTCLKLVLFRRRSVDRSP